MIVVHWWLDNEFPDRPSWNCFVVDEPETNYTDRPYEAMQSGLIGVYNAKHATALTAGDFQWVEIDRPA